jgi:hypothetical protein
MLKLSTFVLSFTILIQSFNFDVSDISNISVLTNHISDHLDRGDNLIDFIDLHYGNKLKSHQDKHSEHQKLPFKHQHIDNSSLLLYIINSDNLKINSIESTIMVHNFNYKEPTSNLYINRFFQPPQK